MKTLNGRILNENQETVVSKIYATLQYGDLMVVNGISQGRVEVVVTNSNRSVRKCVVNQLGDYNWK